MPSLPFKSIRTAGLAILLGLAWHGTSLAQLGGGMPGGLGSNPMGSRRDQGQAAKPLPPGPEAIPGAKSRAPAAPATKTPLDMQPNDALFDAINRGDMASARDALDRGADLNAVNVLGMTPMELAIDLGRNDIAFLLLSMRGAENGRGARASARGAGQPVAKTEQAAAKPAPAKAGSKQPRVAEHVPPPKPKATPKLFAADGGTPQPNVGFLGFDSRPASN